MAQSTVLQTPRLIMKFPYGLNENNDPDIGECISGYNFELAYSQSALIPRPPFDLAGTAPNANSIDGIMQLVKRDNTQTTLIAAGTSVYTFDGTTWTSKASITAGSKLRDTYWSLGDYLVITDVNLKNVVKKWDGTTFGNMTTGLGAVPLYAKFGIVHLNRVWLFNVTTNTATPHLMVASSFEDPTTFNVSNRGGPTNYGGYSGFTTGLEPFFLLSPDLKPINGVALIGYDLVISTTGGRMFKLTGTDAKTFQWTDFYDGSPCVSDEAMANIGNDIAFMRPGGHINSLATTQFAGNAKTSELSSFLPTTVSNLNACLIGYDQGRQKVYFFVSGKVLVLYKDLIPTGKSPWSVYTTTDTSNFNTNAVKYMYQPGTTNYFVYWGDSTGRLFKMDGTGAGDAGSTAVSMLRKSRLIDKTVLNPWPYNVEILHGRTLYRRNGQFDLTLSFDWQDEFNVSSSIVTLKGPPSNDTGVYFGGPAYFGGLFYFNQGFSYTQKVSSKGFSPTGKGPSYFFSVSASTTVNYKVDEVDLY